MRKGQCQEAPGGECECGLPRRKRVRAEGPRAAAAAEERAPCRPRLAAPGGAEVPSARRALLSGPPCRPPQGPGRGRRGRGARWGTGPRPTEGGGPGRGSLWSGRAGRPPAAAPSLHSPRWPPRARSTPGPAPSPRPELGGQRGGRAGWREGHRPSSCRCLLVGRKLSQSGVSGLINLH